MHPQSITDPRFKQRFFAKLARVPSGCLEWQGGKFANGYGITWCAVRRAAAALRAAATATPAICAICM